MEFLDWSFDTCFSLPEMKYWSACRINVVMSDQVEFKVTTVWHLNATKSFDGDKETLTLSFSAKVVVGCDGESSASGISSL